VPPRLRLRNHVIQALHAPVDWPQAIEAASPIAGMDGLAQLAHAEKIHLFEASGRQHRNGREFTSLARIRPAGRNLFGQIHLYQVAFLTAFQHAQGSVGAKPAQGRPYSVWAKTDTLGEPVDGEAELPFTFE